MFTFNINQYAELELPKSEKRSRIEILTDDQKAKRLYGFFVSLAPNEGVPLHYHDRRESLIMVIKGDATEVVEGKEHPVKAGDILFVPAGEKHKMINKSRSQVSFIEFYTPVEDDFIKVE